MVASATVFDETYISYSRPIGQFLYRTVLGFDV
jgi:hypothetical protein